VHVIATAGHVNHGKSTLIRALTGMEPDRWAEERRRGMTIDLGYAWTTLANGTDVAFVDVPGHDHFITNMLAGIGPVPAVLLVIAADEGWCRQTAEHVAALNALDVRHGVLAITRSDLGDADLAVEEARDYLHGTSLAGIEAVAVSPIAGTGLTQLREALTRMTIALSDPAPAAARLWIDRVFTIRGAGTVVTGTLSSGAISNGDELRMAPTNELVRVRGLESLKVPTETASAVARVAVNLRGVKTRTIRRGNALVTPGLWVDVSVIDVRLVNVTSPFARQLVLHCGSAATGVRVRVLGEDAARLTLAHPLPLHVGDRALLRDPGQQHVVAGVIVLDTDPPKLSRRGATSERAVQLKSLTGVPDPSAEVVRRKFVRRSALLAAGVMTRDDADPDDAIVVGDWLVDSGQWRDWQTELESLATNWADQHPMAPGMPRAVAESGLRLPQSTLIEHLIGGIPSMAIDGTGIHRVDAAITFPPEVQQALDSFLERLAENPFGAPEAAELVAAGLAEGHLAAAVRQGLLIKVTTGIYLRSDALDQAVTRLAELPQPFTLSEARIALNTTRRVAMPVLELLDRRRLTYRVDSLRRAVR
jgi:selenocysteine-specific elongation factor